MAMISAADKEVGLKIRVTNKGGEDAHYTQLLATLPESLSYASYTSKEKSVSQQAVHTATTLHVTSCLGLIFSECLNVYTAKKLLISLCIFLHLPCVVTVSSRSVSSHCFSLCGHAQVYCTADGNGTQVKCELGNPLPRDAEVSQFKLLCTVCESNLGCFTQ